MEPIRAASTITVLEHLSTARLLLRTRPVTRREVPPSLDHSAGVFRNQAIHTLDLAEEMSPINKARFYSALGETDKTFEILRRMVDENALRAGYMNGVPDFRPLRSDPRFTDLLLRMNLEP